MGRMPTEGCMLVGSREVKYQWCGVTFPIFTGNKSHTASVALLCGGYPGLLQSVFLYLRKFYNSDMVQFG